MEEEEETASANKLITPQLLHELREADMEAAHQEYAESLVSRLADCLTYEKVLKAMLRGQSDFKLDVLWVKGCQLARLEQLVRPAVQAHLDTLVDPAHYSWQLYKADLSIRLLLTEREPWWAAALRSCSSRDCIELAMPLLKELSDAGLITPESLTIRESGNAAALGSCDNSLPWNLVIEWTGFRCNILSSGKFYLYRDQTDRLVGTPLTGAPGEVAKTIRAAVVRLTAVTASTTTT